jgi:hypothetical protein
MWLKEAESLKISSAVLDVGKDLCGMPKDSGAEKKADADLTVKNNDTVADTKSADVKSGN